MAAQPEAPVRGFSFTDWQVAHPTEPPPGDHLDGEYDRTNSSVEDLIDWAATSLKTDGTIRDGVVGKAQLVSGLFDDVAQDIIDQVDSLVAEAEAASAQALASAASAAASATGAETQNSAAQAAAEDAQVAAGAADLARQDAQGSATIAGSRAADAANSANHASGDAALAEDWGIVSAAWAEHMPDTIPPNILAVMGVTGDHWSSRWWAHKAAAAFGSLSELYLGVWPAPPTSTSTGDPIPIGAIYYNSVSQQPFVWTGTEWVPFYAPTKSLLLTLVYTATADQTAFPLTTPDMAMNSFTINAAAPEPVDVYVNGLRKASDASTGGGVGNWTLNPATSTLTFESGLSAGDLVQIDVLAPASSIAPSRVQTQALMDFDIDPATGNPGQIDGVRTTFPLRLAAPPYAPVSVASAQELFVSVDGVVQQPGSDYNVTGGNITLIEAPLVGARAWAAYYGPGTAGGSTGTAYLPITGGVLTGALTLDGSTPTLGAHAASKAYVDSQIGAGGAGPFLKISGGTVTGATTFSATGTGLAVTNGMTVGTSAIVGGTLTAGNTAAIKVSLVGGASNGFVQSTGGPLMIQAPSGKNVILNPQGLNDVINVKQGLFIDLFNVGQPAAVAGHIQGVKIAATDSMVATDGVWWVNVTGNVGALPWVSGENLTTTGNRRNSFGNIYTNSTTGICGATPPTGTTVSSDGTVNWTWVSTDFQSNRVGLNSNLSVRSQTAPNTPLNQMQWIAHSGTFVGSASQGGTAPSSALSRGTGYAGSDQAWLYAGATNWGAILGRETDVGIFNGGNRSVASAKSRWGILVASYGEDQGAQDDAGIAFGSTGVPFNMLFQINEYVVQWGGSLGTKALMAYQARPQGTITAGGDTYANPAADRGIDLANIRFATAAFRGPSNSGIDELGWLFSGALNIGTTQTAVEIDVPGSISNGIVWAGATGSQAFKAGDELYNLETGMIAKILTVDGSGRPLTITDDPAQGGRRGAVTGTPPANPLLLIGGTGGTVANPPLVTVTWNRINILNFGSAGANTINIGRVGGTVNILGSATGPFLPIGGGTLTGLLTGVGATFTGTFTVGNSASGNAVMVMNGPSGAVRQIRMQTAGLLRWQLQFATAESTGNVGADLLLNRYDDTGASLGTLVTFTRSSGATKFTNGLSVWNVATPVARPAVTGSRGGNAALASFLTAMASYGYITDSTTA